MILRRLTKHIEDQNWFAVALDFFIVVMGILIAFQITNWNAGRGERAQEVQYLSSMMRDVESSIRVLDKSIYELEKQQAARKALYEFHEDPEAELAPEELDTLVARSLFSLSRAEVNQTTFKTLRSSGQLSLLKSPKLVEALQDLSAELAMAEADRNEDFQFTYRTSDPLLVEEGDIDNILLIDLGAAADHLSWVKKQPGPGYSSELVRSSRFKNMILFRALFGQYRIDGYRKILDSHNDILALIGERQAELGVTL